MTTRKLLTEKSWPTYLELGGQETMFGYMDATFHIMPVIKKMLKKAKSFDELKSELTEFYTNRENFIKDVNEKWDIKP